MDSTDLSELLANAPVQQQQFAPMAGGGDPFSNPITPPMQTKPAIDYTPQFSMLRYSLKNLFSYFSYFLAAFIISLFCLFFCLCNSSSIKLSSSIIFCIISL